MTAGGIDGRFNEALQTLQARVNQDRVLLLGSAATRQCRL